MHFVNLASSRYATSDSRIPCETMPGYYQFFASMFVDFQQAPTTIEAPAPAVSLSFEDAYARARAHANGGQPDLALAEYTALLARAPGDADVLLGRGIVLMRLERWNEAETDLKAAASAAPAYADVWEALGNLYRFTGRTELAAGAYQRLQVLDAARAQPYLAMLAAPPEAPAPEQQRAASPEAAITAEHSWLATVNANWLDVGDTPRWNEQNASVRHYMARGSLAFETLRAHRFGQTGHAWALDGYVGLWRGAYANVRYQRASGSRLFPANAGRVELYQPLGHGWELSLSDDVLGFDQRVNIYGVGLARYVGNFYVQLRHQEIDGSGARSSGDRLLGRYYYKGDADSYVELRANRGRSDDALSLTSGRARSGGGGIDVVHYFTRDWGGRLGASFARDGSGSDRRERGVAFSLYRRW